MEIEGLQRHHYMKKVAPPTKAEIHFAEMYGKTRFRIDLTKQKKKKRHRHRTRRYNQNQVQEKESDDSQGS